MSKHAVAGSRGAPGRIDFASRALGSRVHLHGTSPSFHSNWLSNYISLGRRVKSPTVVCEGSPDAGLAVGDCWAFPGSSGMITIVLARPVVPTDFAIEHVARSPGMKRTSAPRRLQVFGIEGSVFSPQQEVLLAEYEYSLQEPATQSFPCRTPLLTSPVQVVRVHILSNHGHPDYTCLYRFRVYSKVSLLE